MTVLVHNSVSQTVAWGPERGHRMKFMMGKNQKRSSFCVCLHVKYRIMSAFTNVKIERHTFCIK